jgi:hypothetical protein
MSTDVTRRLDGLLAEFEFIREGLRQDQRERQVFLGFALAASGTVLGLLVRPGTVPSPNQVLVFVLIAGAVTIVAEVLTIRATLGVASAGVYLRIFVEPYVDGLAFQSRNRRFLDNMDSRISASWGFAVAYLMLSFALALAWFSVHLSSPRGVWQSGIGACRPCEHEPDRNPVVDEPVRMAPRGACVGSRRRR